MKTIIIVATAAVIIITPISVTLKIMVGCCNNSTLRVKHNIIGGYDRSYAENDSFETTAIQSA